MSITHPIPVGMIGAGRHATKVLLPSLYSVPQLDLVAVATSREESAREAERRLKRKAYAGYRSMLEDAEIEGVIVVGGPHEEEMLACLQAGKHVFCETPAITNPGAAERIIQERDKAGKICIVGSCLRFSPVYRKMKDLLGSWPHDDDSRVGEGGGRFWQVRYFPYVRHFFNLLLYLNGAISSVFCFKVPDGAVTLVRFANGDAGSVTWRQFQNNNLPYESVEAASISGCLRVTDGREIAFWNKPPGAARQPYDSVYEYASTNGFEPTFSLPYGAMDQLFLRGYIPELEEFARLMIEGGETTCGIEDMEETRKVWDAVDRSGNEGHWIDIN